MRSLAPIIRLYEAALIAFGFAFEAPVPAIVDIAVPVMPSTVLLIKFLRDKSFSLINFVFVLKYVEEFELFILSMFYKYLLCPVKILLYKFQDFHLHFYNEKLL